MFIFPNLGINKFNKFKRTAGSNTVPRKSIAPQRTAWWVDINIQMFTIGLTRRVQISNT